MSRGRPISLFDFFSRLYFCQPCHLLFAVRHELVEAAVGLQYIRDRDRAVGLESVLQERDQHARRCDHGVVQRVRKILLAVLAVHADAEAARLGVAERGARADLELLLLARGPGFDVERLDLQVGEVAGAAFERADGDVHGAEEIDGVVPEAVEPHHAVLGLADHDHFLFLELVDAVHAAFLNAVRAFLLAEAGGIAGEGEREEFLGEDLVDETADHGVFAGADEIEVFALDLVHHGVHFGEAHDAGDDVTADHEGRHAVGEAAVDHEVAGVGEDAGVQARDVADEVVEAVAGHAAGAVQVDAAEALHDVGVVRDLEIGHEGLAETFQLDVFRVVLSDGHGGVDDVRDDHHSLQEFFLHADFLGGELVDARGVAGHFRLDLFGLIFLALPHQLADLLGDGLAFGAESFDLGLDLAVALVELQDLVDEREFAVLERKSFPLTAKLFPLP